MNVGAFHAKLIDETEGVPKARTDMFHFFMMVQVGINQMSKHLKSKVI